MLKKIWTDHTINLRQIRLRKSIRIDKSRKDFPDFKEGDRVLVRNFVRGPFDPKFEDGYTVIKQCTPNILKLSKGPNTYKINIHHIKKAVGRPKRRKQIKPKTHSYNLRNQQKQS